MKIANPVIEASFIERLNRFEALVNIDNNKTLVHVPNSGRLKELLIPGARVFLEVRDRPGRKTPYELEMVCKGRRLISIDSQVPNRLMSESLLNKSVPGFERYNVIEREKTYGNSRFDIRMSDGKETCYMEIKGVTLESDGVAMFPDAPTVRGSKHVRELMDVAGSGMRAVLMFVIQMDGIEYFTPNAAMDPVFADNVKEASLSGVEIYAYNCTVSTDSICLNKRIS